MHTRHTHSTYITSVIQRIIRAVGKLVHQFIEFIEDIHDHSSEHLALAATKCNLLQLQVLQGSLKVVLTTWNENSDHKAVISTCSYMYS